MLPTNVDGLLLPKPSYQRSTPTLIYLFSSLKNHQRRVIGPLKALYKNGFVPLGPKIPTHHHENRFSIFYCSPKSLLFRFLKIQSLRKKIISDLN